MAEGKLPRIIKTSPKGEYILVKYNDQFYVCNQIEGKITIVCTPNGTKMRTMYRSLAEKLFEDIQKYGPECMSSESILPWHYTMCENFVKMEHEQIEEMLDACFMQKTDWTYDSDNKEWQSLFGSENDRIADIRKWLSKCTRMQMTAACCIGNAYHSINLAFVLAWLMENYTDKRRQKRLEDLAKMIVDNSLYGPVSSILNDFNNFNLYYGIHLDENGAVINKTIPDFCSKEIELFEVTKEMLVGRNYYHYTDGKLDSKQPFVLNHDLSSIVTDDDEEEIDNFSGYIPNDCWVKKISAVEDGSELYYIIALQVENGKIKKITTLLDEVNRMGGGWFYMPEMSMSGIHSYEEINLYDYDAVVREIELLKKGRFMPDNYSFIGKKLPEMILDENMENGDETQYLICQQSAHRLAYIDLFIETDEDGVVNEFDYTTYLSSGSSYGDMFSRPQEISDLNNEAVDMLLYIYDAYTDEEMEKQ